MSTLSSFFFRYIKSLFTKENKNQLFQVEGLTLFQRSEIHWWQNKFLAHPPHVRSEETDRNDFGGKKGHRARNCCIYIGQILCDWASKTPTLCNNMLAWGVHKMKNLSDTQHLSGYTDTGEGEGQLKYTHGWFPWLSLGKTQPIINFVFLTWNHPGATYIATDDLLMCLYVVKCNY